MTNHLHGSTPSLQAGNFTANMASSARIHLQTWMLTKKRLTSNHLHVSTASSLQRGLFTANMASKRWKCELLKGCLPKTAHLELFHPKTSTKQPLWILPAYDERYVSTAPSLQDRKCDSNEKKKQVRCVKM